VALAVRVYQQTHSPWAVTAVLLAAGLPVVLLAPLAGMLLDRVRIGLPSSRRRGHGGGCRWLSMVTAGRDRRFGRAL